MHQHLLPLSQLDDYRVAKEDPDVRRWTVNDAEGERVGVVHDLIVDLETMSVALLDIALERRVTRRRRAESPPHVLVPLALVRVAADADVVTFSQLTWKTIAMLPEYHPNALTRGNGRHNAPYLVNVIVNGSRRGSPPLS